MWWMGELLDIWIALISVDDLVSRFARFLIYMFVGLALRRIRWASKC